MIEQITKEVYTLLGQDDTGHGIDHIKRVLKLSLQFTKQEQTKGINVNEEIVTFRTKARKIPLITQSNYFVDT